MQITDVGSLRRLLVSPHTAMADRLLGIMAETGTLLKGHFELDAARHAPYFIRFSQIGWRQDRVDEIAAFLLEVAPFVGAPATIVCAETSAIFLAHALGHKTGNPVAVTAVDASRYPTATLRTGTIADDLPILIVSDVITTGRSLLPLLSLKSSTAQVLGIVSFAVLSAARFEYFARTHKLRSRWLVAATWRTYGPTECPGCAAAEPLWLASEFS